MEQPIRRLGLQTAPLTSCLGLKEAADDAAPKTRKANTNTAARLPCGVCTEPPPLSQHEDTPEDKFFIKASHPTHFPPVICCFFLLSCVF